MEIAYEPWKYDYRVQTIEEGETRRVLVWQWRYGEWEFDYQKSNDHALEHFLAQRQLVDNNGEYAYWR